MDRNGQESFFYNIGNKSKTKVKMTKITLTISISICRKITLSRNWPSLLLVTLFVKQYFSERRSRNLKNHVQIPINMNHTGCIKCQVGNGLRLSCLSFICKTGQKTGARPQNFKGDLRGIFSKFERETR